MSVEKIPAAPGIQPVLLNPDANGKSGHYPHREGRSAQSEKDNQEKPEVFVNDLGHLTGRTINIKA